MAVIREHRHRWKASARGRRRPKEGEIRECQRCPLIETWIEEWRGWRPWRTTGGDFRDPTPSARGSWFDVWQVDVYLVRVPGRRRVWYSTVLTERGQFAATAIGLPLEFPERDLKKWALALWAHGLHLFSYRT